MKTLVLLFAGMLFSTNSVMALDLNKTTINTPNHYRYVQPVTFVENGIEFSIFPDGNFDYEFLYNTTYYNSNSRRSSINASYSNPRVSVNYTSTSPNRNFISRDRNGTIRDIGNIPINYDRTGNVTQIGSVFIGYGRGKNATLNRVGGLTVNYNSWGQIVSTKGYVNSNNRHVNYCVIENDLSNNYSHHNNNDSYYYYKKNGKTKKLKKRN
ncbi:hypothetical protein [Aestuariibaculum marinum]|uniref:Uncharacterized protein n=1 Tax=Aestuariibaculum marinum TaxID=2683592 RepID=A0A8J6Q166_9FLAO|nr:hypothetical protein [Aestuariibaculum marinum]MBD0822798.1 hypothetical protein [Aestuariibaculum marinum]